MSNIQNPELELKEVFKHSSEAVFIIDEKGILLFTNKAWEKLTGYECNSCLGTSIKKYFDKSESSILDEIIFIKKSSENLNLYLHTSGNKLDFVNLRIAHNLSGLSNHMIGFVNKVEKSINSQSDTACINYASLMESLGFSTFLLDENYRFLSLNSAWTELTSYSVDDCLGKHIFEYFHETQSEQIENIIINASSHPTKKTALSLRKANGNFVPVHLNIHINEKNLTPEKITYSGVIIDITDQINSEIALKDSQERYYLAACAANDGIWDWDLRTNDVYLSPRWKDQLGYLDNELKSELKSWLDRVHKDDIKSAMNDVMDCIEGTTPLYQNLHRLQHKDGSWKWILDRGVVLRDDNGAPFRMAGSHADVTELKNIEEHLLRREQELEAIFSISPDGILTINHDGSVGSITPSVSDLTGLNNSDLINLDESELYKKLSSICETPLNISDLKGFDRDDTYKQTIYISDQSKLSKNQNLSKLTNHKVLKLFVRKIHDQPISKVIYLRDISFETQIDRMKTEFLSTAAHELRTPMSSIFGFTELLLHRNYDDQTKQEIINTIHNQSQSIINMLNELLDLARIEAREGRDFVFKKIQVSELIKKSLSELMIPGDLRKVKTTRIPKDIHIYGDIEKLLQALANVISNAYKYSNKNSPITLRVIKRLNDMGTQDIGIQISDQGIGMTVDQKKKIFDRFWRADTSDKVVGTGLGMSLVKEIIDFHHGSIDVSSVYAKGTTVTLWLNEYN